MMDLSESYKKQLIEDWEMAVDDYGWIPDVCWYHTSDAWLVVRDEIRDAGLEEHPKVKELDEKLIRWVLKNGSDKPRERLTDDRRNWWWFLDEIATRTFPAEYLPPYLRKIYQEV